MAKRVWCLSLLAGVIIAAPTLMSGAQHPALDRKFQTSDRCLACHNGMVTSSGQDVSIGLDWRSGMMANSSRDPYWQGSVRRESIDHPESRADIEDVCSTCHMPMSHYEAKWQGRKAEVFSFLPFEADPKKSASAEDGVSCSVCHQISREKLGTRESFNGGFVTEVNGAVPVTSVLGVPRAGVHRHVFVAANFFVQGMLNRYRQDLDVVALPEELTAASERTVAFLQSESARVSIRSIGISSGSLQAEVFVQNLSGHKLPTAYPSRRAWLHVIVKDHEGHTVFESGALNPDGSIQGNDNDADPTRFEPHYREITSGDQVEIYEPILKDSAGRVTTGLLSAVGYLKDNRLLPSGFRKDTAEKDIAVVGEAADDPDFTDAGSLVRYSVALADAQGPFRVEAELWYNPSDFVGHTILVPMTRQNPAASSAITIRWRRARPLCWLGQRPHAEGWAVPPII